MKEPVRGEVVAIGTELLLGDLIDTNSAYIAGRLKNLGVNLHFKTTVGDNLERIAAVIGQAHRRSQVVITTGGLGPTVDDLTREAVAQVMGVPLEFRQDLLDYIEAYFRRRGFRMSENNRRQARVPRGAIVLENPRGTAPCFIVEDELGCIISVPGVPGEMRYMIDERAVPYLRRRFQLEEVICTLTLKSCALGESRVDELISDLFRESVNPSIAVLAHPGQVDIRITAKAKDEGEAQGLIRGLEKRVRERLGTYVYGEGEEAVERAVGRLLAGRGVTLAVLETNTGGAVLQRLSAWPERVRFLKRGLVALGAGEAASALGLPWEVGGDPSGGKELAMAAASRLRALSGATLGLAVVGPNPPENIEPERSRTAPAVGNTHFAVAGPEGSAHFEQNFGGNEQFVQSRASVFALDVIRRYLLYGPGLAYG